MEKTKLNVHGVPEDVIKVGTLFVAKDDVVRAENGQALIASNAGTDWHTMLQAVRAAARHFSNTLSQTDELAAARTELLALRTKAREFDLFKTAFATFAKNVHEEAIEQDYCDDGYNEFIKRQPKILNLQLREQEFRVELERDVTERQKAVALITAEDEDKASDLAVEQASDLNWTVKGRDTEEVEVVDVSVP